MSFFDDDGEPKRRVECRVEHVTEINGLGNEQEAVRVTCSRCDHSETSFGRSERSINRCLALLRENCPEGEENFYIADEPEEHPEWWMRKPPRGKHVETPEVLKNLPLKPPGRR